MKITLNGQEKELPDSLTLKSIIEQFCRDTQHIIAEVNGDIIKNQHWPQKTLSPGDTVELVNFVGGG